MIPNNKRLIKKQIKALETVLQEYKDAEHDTDKCALCEVAFSSPLEAKVSACHNCPWIWFTNVTCDVYIVNHFLGSEGAGRVLNQYSNECNEKAIKKRIKTIPKWIKKLENEL